MYGSLPGVGLGLYDELIFSGLRQCVKGKVSVVGVTTKNHAGELVTSGNAQFETYLQNVSSGKRTSPEVCDNRNGNYELGETR